MSSLRIFYGWFVVAAAFAVTFVGFGSAYTFSAFIPPLQQDFGASRGSISLVFSLASCLYFCVGAISGPLADRWGAKPLATAGMLLVALGLILAAGAPTLPRLYAAYGVGIGLGVGCSYVPVLGAVQRWFIELRGLASGFAVSGIGIGTLLMPPLSTALITAYGWRRAYLILGVMAAVLGIGGAAFIEDNPRNRGLEPDGRVEATRRGSPTEQGLSVGQAIRTTQFLGLYAACLVGALGMFVPLVHLVPYALDHGIKPTTAVLLLSAIGAGSTVGRFFLGGIADRVGRDALLTTMYVGIAVSLAIWPLAAGVWSLLGFAFAFGLCYGGWVAVLPAVAADHFGTRHVSGILGVLSTSAAVGTLVGPAVAGFMFDANHSYAAPILASAIANGVAAAIIHIAVRRVAPAPIRGL
jgi:MFS transporter, OFA family, oxalate/formate antiporter